MPTADESQAQRQTFGEAQGWGDTQRGEPPTGPGPAPEAQLDASPASDAPAPSADSQTTETESVESPTPGTELPFNKHPRWIERQQELERERKISADLQRQNQLLLETMQRVAPQPTKAPVHDPWEGLVNHPDPATAQFYQQQRALVQHERQQAKQEAIAELMPVIDAGRQEIARLNTKEFRKENPEIQPGSPNEALVVAYMEGRMDGVAHPIESAKRNAMYDKLEAENRALKSKQATVPQKRAAAQPESSAGMPQTAGLPPKPGDWRERAGAVIDAGGDFVEVAQSIFGGGRRR